MPQDNILTPGEIKTILDHWIPYSGDREKLIKIISDDLVGIQNTKLAKLSAVPDEEIVEIVAKRLFKLEFKTDLYTWATIKQGEYLIEARQLLSQVSAVYEARLAKAIEEAEQRGINKALTAYESTCEALIQAAVQKARIAEHLELIANIRQAVAVEYKKAVSESNQTPFQEDNLNEEHHILWKGETNAYSETLSYLDELKRKAMQAMREAK